MELVFYHSLFTDKLSLNGVKFLPWKCSGEMWIKLRYLLSLTWQYLNQRDETWQKIVTMTNSTPLPWKREILETLIIEGLTMTASVCCQNKNQPIEKYFKGAFKISLPTPTKSNHLYHWIIDNDDHKNIAQQYQHWLSRIRTTKSYDICWIFM